MGVTAVFSVLTSLLTAQTQLVTAITASQPPNVAAELWTRFADDTRWIHDMLAKMNNHLEKLIGVADTNVNVTQQQVQIQPPSGTSVGSIGTRT